MMRIAPEGKYIVIGVMAFTALALFFGWVCWGAWSLPLILPLIFVLQFFRDPQRKIQPPSESDVLSPADGKIVFIGKATSPVTNEEVLKISVFMNVFNVHVNRAPVSGEVIFSERRGGGFFNAALDKASDENERHLITIDSPQGKITCVQIAGLLARRVLCYADVGNHLQAGQRYGFIRFGSRVDLYLPQTCQPTIALGDKVAAGRDCVARW